MQIKRETVIRFMFADIPVIGNFDSQAVIGLTNKGSEVVERALRNDVPSQEFDAIDCKLLPALVAGGFCTESECNCKLTAAYIHVTEHCNFSCKNCYSYKRSRNLKIDASLSDLKCALKKLALGGVTSIVISGGEPFLRNDLSQIVRFAKEQCKIPSITILSNGSLINKSVLASLTGFVDVISVSFDGFNSKSEAHIRNKQNYEMLVSKVNLIKDAGIHAHIIPTIHAKNFTEIYDYQQLAHNMGVSINFSLLTDVSALSGDTSDLIPSPAQLKQLGNMIISPANHEKTFDIKDMPVNQNLGVKKNCGAGIKLLSIAANGDVFPCHMFHNTDLVMGNIFKQDLSRILNSEVGLLMKGLCVDDFSNCFSCKYKYLCGGGCRARSYYAFRQLNAPDAYCPMIKEFFSTYELQLKTRYAASERR